MTIETTEARALPWYHVGVQFEAGDAPATVQSALEAADLDWDVELRRTGFVNPKGNFVRDQARYHVVRTDTEEALGVVGTQYRCLQNRDAFKFANELAGDGAEFAAAWSERGGSRVGLAMRLGDQVDLVEQNDPAQGYLVLQTSHNGTRSIQAGVSYFQIGCTNQLPTLTSNCLRQWRGFHTDSLAARMAAASDILELADEHRQAYQARIQELADVKVSDSVFESIINSTLADLNIKDRAAENAFSEIELAWHDSPTMKQSLRNTGYGTLHAVTEYWDHLREYKTDNSRFHSNAYGRGLKHRNLVADRLLEMASA